MDAKEINRLFDLQALAEKDTRLKKAGKFFIGPCPFCGGTDRFNLTRKPEGWRWLCRNCTATVYKTPIDYLMQRTGKSFTDVMRDLSNNFPTLPPVRHQVEPEPKREILPDQDWQAKAWRMVTAAGDALPGSRAAITYLESRGLPPSVWGVYLLGFDIVFDVITKTKRPAILIPWWDVSYNPNDEDTITAIKYRFIDDLAKDKKHRFGSLGGSKQILFGLHCAAGSRILFLVEGEFNAMSIFKASCDQLLGIDCLSFGSQAPAHSKILGQVAQDYRQVIVWADDAEQSKKIRTLLPCPAGALCSPVIDGEKYDANLQLQKGLLAEFLTKTIETQF